MLNYNLKGESLVHCLKISGVKLVLVDTDKECTERFEASKKTIEKELGVSVFFIDSNLFQSIYSRPVQVPGDEYRYV
jgi:hypothetical protein